MERTSRYIVMGYVDWIKVSAGIVQTLIYLEYSQPFWSPISGRIGMALSSPSVKEEKVLIDDAQEKGLAIAEKVFLTADITPKHTEKPSVANDSSSE